MHKRLYNFRYLKYLKYLEMLSFALKAKFDLSLGSSSPKI